jgi:hypothetical protein
MEIVIVNTVTHFGIRDQLYFYGDVLAPYLRYIQKDFCQLRGGLFILHNSIFLMNGLEVNLKGGLWDCERYDGHYEDGESFYFKPF